TTPDSWGVATTLAMPVRLGSSSWIRGLSTMFGWSSKTNAPGSPGTNASADRTRRARQASANERSVRGIHSAFGEGNGSGLSVIDAPNTNQGAAGPKPVLQKSVHDAGRAAHVAGGRTDAG